MLKEKLEKITIMQLLEDLGVPESKRGYTLKVIEGESMHSVSHGSSAEGYHGYIESANIYDPYSQLVEVGNNDYSTSYANIYERIYKYIGVYPCAITTRTQTINSFQLRLYLFLPEGMKKKVIFQAEEKGEVTFEVPYPLKKKWIREVSKKEGRNPKLWHNYARVVRKVWHKALVFAAYQFAEKHPDKIGLIHDIWGGYNYDSHLGLSYYGTSILVADGSVEFVDVKTTEPSKLVQEYGITEYYTIDVELD